MPLLVVEAGINQSICLDLQSPLVLKLPLPVGYDNLLFEIIDISGKVVSTYALMPSKENNQSVSIGNLSGGTYIARVLNGANSNALKFIVFN
jgi:hypothetical protein